MVVNWEVDIILQWSLGWGTRRDVLLPPPDFIAGCAVWLWTLALYRQQKRVRIAAQGGDEVAAQKVLLQAFIPLIACVGLGTGIAAAASILLSVLEDRAPATPLAVLVILSFIRSVATETVSQGFAIVFCFKGFPRNILKKSFLYASIWAAAVATVNAVMFVLYHKSAVNGPRLFALATSGVVFLGFLCVAFAFRMSRHSLRPYAIFVLIWRAVQIAGICLSFFDDMRVAAIVFDIVFIVIQGVGWPVSMHVTLVADTMHWRTAGLPKHSHSSQWLRFLSCCCGDLPSWAYALPYRDWYLRVSGKGALAGPESDEEDGARTPLSPSRQRSQPNLDAFVRASSNASIDVTGLSAHTSIRHSAVGLPKQQGYGSFSPTSPVGPEVLAESATVSSAGPSRARSPQHHLVVSANSRSFSAFYLEEPKDDEVATELSAAQSQQVARVLVSYMDATDGCSSLTESQLFGAVRTIKAPLVDFAFIKLGQPIHSSGPAIVLEADFADPTLPRHKRKIRKVAVKTLTIPEMNMTHVHNALKEAEICYQLRHPNIVELIGVCVCPPSLSLVFEFCKFGDLRMLLDAILSKRQGKGYVDTPTSCYDRNAFYGSQRDGDSHSGTASPMSWNSDAESHTDGEEDAKAIVSAVAARHARQHVHAMDVGDIRVAAIRERDFLERQPDDRVPCITWYMRLRMAVHIARAVEFLHDQRPPVLHRDIKSKNVLVAEGNVLKLTDFGEAQRCIGADAAVEKKGTFAWMAPEIMRAEKYTEASDVYSVTMVLWELLCYRPPFYSVQSPVQFTIQQAVLENDARPGIPSNTPPSYATLLQFGWHNDVKKRPTMKQMLELLERMQAVARPDSTSK